MVDWQARLESGARRILGRPLGGPETGQFEKYLGLLIKWQKIHRLVGSTDPVWVVDHLFLDSLLFLQVLGGETGDVLDLGAGAGFPGIPLKIVTPEMRLTLMEARQRRASFLRAAVRELGFQEVSVLNARGERVVQELQGSFSAAVMRCAGPAEELVPLATRFVRPGGLIVASASPDSPTCPNPGQRVTVEGLRRGETRHFWVQRRT